MKKILTYIVFPIIIAGIFRIAVPLKFLRFLLR